MNNPRAMATAMVSFGLVSIPVKIIAASISSERISFNMLHDKCKSKLKQQYVCPACDPQVPVSRENTVKGFEFTKDKFVTFTQEELDALDVESSKTIAVEEFLPAGAIDPIYYDGSYFLTPDRGGERAYRLIAEALGMTKRQALARFAIRGKEYVVLLRALGHRIVMQQLRNHDEVRPAEDILVSDASVDVKELALAKKLIENGSVDIFDPSQYEDGAQKQLKKLIDSKIAGTPADLPKAAADKKPDAIVDLMAMLQASLGATADKPRTTKKKVEIEGTPATITPIPASEPKKIGKVGKGKQQQMFVK